MVVAAIGFGAFCKNYYPAHTPEWRAQVAWYEQWFVGEIGIIELGTAVVLLAACVMGVLAVRASRGLGVQWVGHWLFLLLLGSIYFLGEEVSWGQHLVGWSTPDWYTEATGNRQDETNLHNINSWYNQKPRHLFQAWVVIGGIIVPLWWRFGRRTWVEPTRFSYWFWPTWVCILSATLAILVRTPEWIVEGVGIGNGHPLYYWLKAAPPAELQEFCLGMFLLVYFCSAWYRLRHVTDATASPAGLTSTPS